MRTSLVALAALIACGGDAPNADHAGDATTEARDGRAGDTDAASPDGEDAATSDALRADSDGTADADLQAPPALTSPRTFAPALTFGSRHVQPALAFAPDGETLVVAWTGFDPGDGTGIIARPWDVRDAPAPLADPARVNTDTRGLQNEPSACALAHADRVVVAWSVDTQDVGPDGENLEIRFRLLGTDGAPVRASDTRVVTDRPGNHWLARVACDPAGGFVVAGVRASEGDGGFEVFAQGYGADGMADGTPRIPDPVTGGGQAFPSIAAGPHRTWFISFEDTPGADADTIASAFVLAPEGSPTPLGPIPAGSGADVALPQISADPTSGEGLMSAIAGGRVVARPFTDAGAGPPIALPEGADATTSAHALAALGGDAHALVYYRGTGAEVDVRVAHVTADGATGEVDTAFTGRLPLAYRPAIAYRDGRLAVAWTESLGDGAFAIGAALYGPSDGD